MAALKSLFTFGQETGLLRYNVGKGGKTRAVLLSANTWRTLMSLRGAAGPDAPVFLSREGGALDPTQVRRIVKATAPSRLARGDLATLVSPRAR